MSPSSDGRHAGSVPEDLPGELPVEIRDDHHDDFLRRHVTLDDRLDAAFRRYDDAFHNDRAQELVRARLDLSLLLWVDDEPPLDVSRQVALDGETLLESTPPLGEGS